MTETFEASEPLTEDERRRVKVYLESLISERRANCGDPAEPKFLDVDAFAGMFAGLATEKSAVELAHEATELIAAKYEKYMK